MTCLRLTLLGGFEARDESGASLAVPLRKAQALLAYLALPAGQSHPRDKLAALLWGGMQDAQARSGLRQALWSLRRAGVPADAMAMDRDTVALAVAEVEVDVASFVASVRAGTPERLEDAADRYRGNLLAGLVLREGPFEE